MELIGDVKGRNVILVDDMIDTGGTLESRRFNGKGSIERKSNLYTRHLIRNAYE
jgi:hypoxanthine-guanine phosphoribosyltransferase